MKDINISVTRGYNMVFGVLTKKLYMTLYSDIIDVLIANCVPKGNDSDEAESRKQAIRSLVSAVETIGIQNLEEVHRVKILETIYKGFEDYAIDNRGDVGSWVRQESMVQMLRYINLIFSSESGPVLESVGATKPAFYVRYVTANLQQLCEKIDRMREIAGKCLQKFFKYCVPTCNVKFDSSDELTCLFL